VGARNSRGLSIKSFILQYLKENSPAVVDRLVLSAICREATKALQRDKPVSRAYVLEVIGETQIPIDRSLGGLPVDLRGRVHSHDREAAAASLADMTREYDAALAAGDKTRAADCRRAVLGGKDRLKLLLRRANLTPQKREEKQELLQWFLVWLEAPPLFPGWLALRLRAAGAGVADTAQQKPSAEAGPERPAATEVKS
jgi:hypothetical protein